jgi:hypothetical protein
MTDFYKRYNFLKSQTSLKDLEKETTCPVRWRHQWLLKEFESQRTDPMTYGLYFEWLVYGKTAKDDFDISMVPANKNGSKKIEVLRIEQQAEECKRMLYDPSHKNYLGIEVLETQHRIVNEDNDAVVIDVVGRRLSDRVIGHIDLKLTADINNTYSEHGWGNVYGRDYIQQIYYQYVFEKTYGTRVEFNHLLVFDYTPVKGKKLVTITPKQNWDSSAYWKDSRPMMRLLIFTRRRDGPIYRLSKNVNLARCNALAE